MHTTRTSNWFLWPVLAMLSCLTATEALAQDTYADTFEALDYTGSTGTTAWISPWTEIGDDGNHTTGSVQVTSNAMCYSDPAGNNCARIEASQVGIGIERTISGFAAEGMLLTFSVGLEDALAQLPPELAEGFDFVLSDGVTDITVAPIFDGHGFRADRNFVNVEQHFDVSLLTELTLRITVSQATGDVLYLDDVMLALYQSTCALPYDFFATLGGPGLGRPLVGEDHLDSATYDWGVGTSVTVTLYDPNDSSQPVGSDVTVLGSEFSEVHPASVLASPTSGAELTRNSPFVADTIGFQYDFSNPVRNLTFYVNDVDGWECETPGCSNGQDNVYIDARRPDGSLIDLSTTLTSWGSNILKRTGETNAWRPTLPAAARDDASVLLTVIIGEEVKSVGVYLFHDPVLTRPDPVIQGVWVGGMTFDLDVDCATLPVELTTLSALSDGSDVLLSWTTATETNNAGFGIEIDGEGRNHFGQVSFVPGAGTTTQEQHYSYRASGLEPGRHRFRLRQVDFDGTFEYSETVEAVIEIPGGLYVSAHPNPFGPSIGEARISFALATGNEATLDIYNVQGQRVARLFEGQVQGGQTTEVRLSGTDLPSGLYLARLSTGGGFSKSTRLVLIR